MTLLKAFVEALKFAGFMLLILGIIFGLLFGSIGGLHWLGLPPLFAVITGFLLTLIVGLTILIYIGEIE